MKKILILLIISSLFILNSCEISQEQQENSELYLCGLNSCYNLDEQIDINLMGFIKDKEIADSSSFMIVIQALSRDVDSYGNDNYYLDLYPLVIYDKQELKTIFKNDKEIKNIDTTIQVSDKTLDLNKIVNYKLPACYFSKDNYLISTYLCSLTKIQNKEVYVAYKMFRNVIYLNDYFGKFGGYCSYLVKNENQLSFTGSLSNSTISDYKYFITDKDYNITIHSDIEYNIYTPCYYDKNYNYPNILPGYMFN